MDVHVRWVIGRAVGCQHLAKRRRRGQPPAAPQDRGGDSRDAGGSGEPEDGGEGTADNGPLGGIVDALCVMEGARKEREVERSFGQLHGGGLAQEKGKVDLGFDLLDELSLGKAADELGPECTK